MNQKIKPAGLAGPVAGTLIAAPELTAPLAARALFWRAHYLEEAGVLYHLPFLFWLIATLRPRHYVEIGMTEAVSYFAACQAIDRIEPDGRCTGVWHRPAGEPVKIPEAIRWRNAEFYEEFSEIRVDPVPDVAARLDDGSVDILLVNLKAETTLAESLLQDWSAKLSERAVILLHGTETPGFDRTPAAALLRDLCARCPALHFTAGEGLSLLLWGADRHEKLLSLVKLEPGAKGSAEVASVFRRLGVAHQFEWSSRRDGQRMRTVQRDLALAREEAAALRREQDSRAASSQERTLRAATLQARLHDLEAGAQARDAEAAAQVLALTGAAEAARQAHSLLEAEFALFRQEQSKLQDDRFREIAALTSALETERNHHAERIRTLETEAQARDAAAAAQIDALQAELNGIRQEAALYREKFGAIKDSTFWKMTGPARRTVDRLRGIRG